MVSKLGSDSWNWSKLETVLYSVAARLHTSIAPLQVNSFRLSNVSSPTEHSCNIQPKFSNNHDSLYSLQWKPGLVTTWPCSSLECLNRWSYQVITRDFKTLCVCVVVSYVSLTTQSAACWCEALRKPIVPVAEELGKQLANPRTHTFTKLS